ncbi:MAG TPA: PLP-dependent lyase/thiolase [Terriglobales bacterium]|nr:PLP-dependent lyase/thiolase [Terriglobales bacterium]
MSRIATLGEGNTPLVESAEIGREYGLRILFKLEMCNPTGSYKDRFIAAEITELLTRNIKACIATSSGNTGASLASFSSRYRIACAIFVNEAAPAGKLAQMQAHGARVFRVKDFVTSPEVTARVYRRLDKISKCGTVPMVVSAYRYCPNGMKGVERIAKELIEQSNSQIDHVFVPVGGGGLFSAVSRGFSADGNPRTKIHAVQPEGCATVVSAFVEGRNSIEPIVSTTCVSGLSVPYDIDASLALSQLRQGGGRGVTISDRDVFEAQQLMMKTEGIWCEPAGAAALAGCLRARRAGWINKGETVVCLVTGHGFKDPESLVSVANANPVKLIDEGEIGAELLGASA